MSQDWDNLTPYNVVSLSASSLLACNEVFSTGDVNLFAKDLLAPHWHDAYELGFIRHGTGQIVMGRHAYSYMPGQVYIINGFDPHMGYANSEIASLFVIHFHPCILEGGWIGQMRHEMRTPFLPQFGTHGPLIPFDHPITGLIRPLLECIRQEALQRQPLWDVIACGYLLQAVALLARQSTQTIASPEELRRSRTLATIRPILQMIQERFTEALSLAELASSIGLSSSYCCDLFNEALGTSPIAYRNTLRLAEARRLMQTTSLTMRAIAYRVGFQSVQELNRLFRRETGCSPRQFLANLQRGSENPFILS